MHAQGSAPRARRRGCTGQLRQASMGKDDKASKVKARLTDHREASRGEKGCFAQLIIRHNDAVQCVVLIVPPRSPSVTHCLNCRLGWAAQLGAG